MKVYVAGSTAEIDRAKFWTSRLQRCNVEVISTWIEVVEAEGCNPRGVSLEHCRRWAYDDIAQIHQADLFWLLVPALDRPSRGAWFELGIATMEIKQTIIVSGDMQQSIFSTLAHRGFEEDVDAFIEIILRAHPRR